MDSDMEITASFSYSTSYTAHFVPYTYSLDITISGNGRVTRSVLKDNYAYGTEVILTAVPDSGNVFSAWHGDADY
ncbi:MAG: InlB B-repeat-containing protein [Spirochaetia bacterium]